MRFAWLVAALAGCLGHGAQAADVTARYLQGAGGGPAMTVQANERGDSRLSFGDQMAVITRDGVTYIVMADLRGPYAILQDDLVAAMREMVRGMAGDIAQEPEAGQAEPQNPYSPTEAGTETVAGRTGTIWLLHPRPANAPESWRGLELVISTDADLAPIGRALARQWTSGDFISGTMGSIGSLAFFPGAVRSIVERGTILRMGRVMRLHSVEQGSVPDSAFTLPGPVLTREQFLARWGVMTPRPD